MFKLELIELLNGYFSSNDDYDRKKKKDSIIKLIKENINEYNDFILNSSLDIPDEYKSFLEECISSSKNLVENNGIVELKKEEVDENSNLNKTKSDILKEYYFKWKGEYIRNNFQVSPENVRIIKLIINEFLPDNLDLIKRILMIKDDENYESFKNMLNNYLRAYYLEKLKGFRNSEEFKSLGFFKKLVLKKKLLKLYDDIGNYIFNQDEINSVLNYFNGGVK